MAAIPSNWRPKFLRGHSSTDLRTFMAAVENENTEHMFFKSDSEDEAFDNKVTYEQVNEARILSEIDSDLQLLKSIESMLGDRQSGYQQFFGSISKSHSALDADRPHVGGSLGMAMDAFFVFIEQELQQAKQQSVLSDLKKQVGDVKLASKNKLTDYQYENNRAEKNVETAEKRLLRAREALEKAVEQKKAKLAAQALAASGAAPPSGIEKISRVLSLSHFRGASAAPAVPLTPAQPVNAPASNGEAIVSPSSSASAPSEPPQSDPGSPNQSKNRDPDDPLVKANVEVRDSIKLLLRSIENRDSIQVASRRAYKTLNVDCRTAATSALRALVQRERESIEAKEQALQKLEAALAKVDVEKDVDDFAESFAREDDALVQCSQALSLIGDISEEQMKGIKSWNPIEPDATDIAAVVAAAKANMSAVNTKTTNEPDSTGDGEDASPTKSETDFPAAEIESTARERSVTNPGASTNSRSASVASDLEFAEDEEGEAEAAITRPKDGDAEGGSHPTAEATYEMLFRIFNQPCLSIADDIENIKKLVVLRSPVDIDDHSTEACSKDIKVLSDAARTQAGRTILVLVLNQFRSKKVDIGSGWLALGKVLWALITECMSNNDVHNAKIVMMLSQTFFRNFPDGFLDAAGAGGGGDDGASSEALKVASRIFKRLYIKEVLLDHPLWQQARFWEQSLWQCMMEQLQTFKFRGAWYDLNAEERVEAIKRVHDVAFSQVMAIAHSMMELGCSKMQAREFVYRMCVIHQLSEPQRHLLLSHLNRHNAH